MIKIKFNVLSNSGAECLSSFESLFENLAYFNLIFDFYFVLYTELTMLVLMHLTFILLGIKVN